MNAQQIEIERALLRLKEQVNVKTDKDIAALLGMEFSALNMRKKRGSFPARELVALASARPELGIDTYYVLTGQHSGQAAEDHRATEDELLAAGWQTELGLLNRMMAWAFDGPRDPRSPEYREGVRDLLLYKLVEKSLKNPFAPGTAHADAWWAGVEEGKAVHRHHLAKGF